MSNQIDPQDDPTNQSTTSHAPGSADAPTRSRVPRSRIVAGFSIAPPGHQAGRPPTGAYQLARNAPEDEASWDAVDDAARADNSPDEAQATYAEVLQSPELSPEARRSIGERAVRFLGEWHEDTAPAVKVLESLLEHDPENAWALEELSVLLTHLERWDDLLAVYDKTLARTSSEATQVVLLEKAARIAKDFAGQALRASAYLKRLFMLRPEDEKLALSLERRLEQQERHQDLVEIWTARLKTVDEKTARSLRVRIAERFLNHLNDSGKALETALDLLGGDQSQSEAWTLLEDIGHAQHSTLESRRKALSTLKTCYADSKQFADVARILNASLEVNEPEAQLQLHQELVVTYEKLDTPDDAQASCAAWLYLQPTGSEALEKLRELAAQTKNFAGLSSALEAASTQVNSGPARVELLLEAATVQHERVGDVPSAALLYGKVLDDDSAASEARLEAARQLRAMLVTKEQTANRLDVLEKLALLEPEADAQRAALCEAAAIAQSLEDSPRALQLWDACLAKDAADLEALDAKVAILSGTEDWSQLQHTLRQRVKHSQDADQRRVDQVQIAKIFDTHQANLPDAIGAWREVEAQFGRTHETIDALSDLCARSERWADLVTLLRDAAPAEAEEQRKTRYLTSLGDIYRVHLDQHLAAVEQYDSALSIKPQHQPARDGLAALLAVDECRLAASSTLAEAYRAASEWELLLQLVETRFEASSTPEQKQAILHEASDLVEIHAGDKPAALDYMIRAFSLQASPEAERTMNRLAEETESWHAAVDGYARALETAPDASRRAALHLNQGRLLEKRLNAPGEAFEAHREILKHEPGHIEAASSAVRCACAANAYDKAAEAAVLAASFHTGLPEEVAETFETSVAEQDSWRQALGALESATAKTNALSPEASHNIKFQLAKWQKLNCANDDDAERLLRAAVDEHRSVPSLLLLVSLLRRNPDGALVETLLKLAEVADDPLPHFEEASRVSVEVATESSRSRPILERTLQLCDERIAKGTDAHAEEVALFCINQLVKAALDTSDYRGAFGLLVRGAGTGFAEDVALNLKHRAAEIAAMQLGETRTAVVLCQEILKSNPHRSESVDLLSTLYEEDGKLDQLLTLRKQQLELCDATDKRLELRLELSRVLGAVGDNEDDQVGVLKQNISEAPGHARSIDALAEILAPRERYLELFEILSEQAKAVAKVGDDGAAARLHARAGLLAEETIDDEERALGAYEASVKLTPDVEVLDALATIRSARKEHEEAVSWLRTRLKLTPMEEAAARRNTYVRLGAALRDCGEVDQAAGRLREGLAENPAFQEVRELLAELYEAQENWPAYSSLLSEGVGFATDDDTKVRYLSRAAEVKWQREGALDLAIPLLSEARELHPESKTLRLTLADALRQSERRDESRNILEGMLVEFGRRRTAMKATVHHQLALIARAEGELDAALSHLDSAANIERDEPKILKTLGDVAREKGELERAERAYRTLLLTVGRGQTDESKFGESAILFELYRIASERNESDRAKDLLDSALEAAEQDPNEAQRLEQALRDAQKWELLLDALERRQGRVKGEEAELAVLVDRAEVLAHLGRLEESLELRLQLLTKSPADERLLDQTQQLAAASNSRGRFVEAVRSIADSYREEEPEIACNLWLRLGDEAEQNGENEQAASHYEQAHSTSTALDRTMDCLCRVHRSPKAKPRLADALRHYVSAAPSTVSADRRADALYKLAEIELSTQGESLRGATSLREALGLQIDNDRALAILFTSLKLQPPTPEVVALLDEVARHAKNEEALLQALEHATLLEDTSLEQLKEAVALAEQLGQSDRKVALLHRTIDFAKSNKALADVTWALTDLSRWQTSNGDHGAAKESLETAIKVCESEEAFELQLELASLLHRGMKKPEKAADVYERLAKERPEDPRAWQPLMRIHRETGELKKLEVCLSRAEKHVSTEAERSSLHLERIRLAVFAERFEEAELALRNCLEQEPQNEDASELLVELLVQQGRPAEVRDLMYRRLDAAIEREDADVIVRYAKRLGQLCEQQGDLDAAMSVYRSAHAAVRRDQDILHALLRLTPDEDTNERANLMESLLPASGAEGAEELALELVALRDELQDSAGVERALELGYRQNPESTHLRDKLERWYREREDWAPLADVFVLDAQRHAALEPALAQFQQAAALHDEQLGDAAAAAQIMEKARLRAPADPEVLELLCQYHLVAGQPDAALSALKDALDNEQLDPSIRCVLLHLRAAVRARVDEHDLVGISLALQDLDEATALGGAQLDDDLAALLDRQRELAQQNEETETERTAMLRLSALLVDLGNAQLASELLAEWIERFPEDQAALRQSLQVAWSVENWESARRAAQLLYDTTHGAEKRDAALQLAESCDRCGSPLDAQQALEEMREAHPSDEDLRGCLRRMYEAAGAHKHLATLLIAQAEDSQDAAQTYDLYVDAGELLLKTETQDPEAVRSFERALGAVPRDHRATLGLAQAHVLNNNIEAACGILEAAIKSHGKKRSPELSELQHGMARVAEFAGDVEGRFAWLDAALQSDRKNGQVASELAVFAMDLGQHDAAIKALQLVTLIKGECEMSRAEAYLRQGVIAQQRGDMRKAVLLAKRALTADSGFTQAHDFLAQLGAA